MNVNEWFWPVLLSVGMVVFLLYMLWLRNRAESAMDFVRPALLAGCFFCVGTLLHFSTLLDQEVSAAPKTVVGIVESISVDDRWFRQTRTTISTQEGAHFTVRGRFPAWSKGQQVTTATVSDMTYRCLDAHCLPE